MDALEGLVVRPIRPDDAERLERMFWRLSPRTVYLRFFSPVPRPRPTVLRHLAEVDHDSREALVVLDGDEIVAVARYDRLDGDPTHAEVAVLVEDAWQSRGLGLRLIRKLGTIARARGVTHFTAAVLGENRRMLHVLRRLSPDAHLEWADGALDVEVPLVAAAA